MVDDPCVPMTGAMRSIRTAVLMVDTLEVGM